MCGICGYIAPDKKTAIIAKSHMTDLLLASQTRGAHATGIAFVDKGKIKYVKAPLEAEEFVKTKEYLQHIKDYTPEIMIGHTRFKTQGDPANNDNNHPVFAGNLALVHNGSIWNDNRIFEEFALKRKGEVDSEAIVALIAHFKKKAATTREAIVKAADELTGGMACALINAKNSRELHLFARTNPIVLAYEKDTGIIYFASEKNFLQDVLFTQKIIRNFFTAIENKNDYLFEDLPRETGIRITAKDTSLYSLELPKKETETETKSWRETYYPPKKAETGIVVKKKPIAGVGEYSYKYKNGKGIHKPKKLISLDDPTVPILKPGKYTTDTLEMRIMYLEEKYLTNTQEYRRLEETYLQRMMRIEQIEQENFERETIKTIQEHAEQGYEHDELYRQGYDN